VVACAGGAGAPPPPIAPSSISPALGINLAEYTRTPEGLYYMDVRVGDGAAATPRSRVAVAYRGLLANGTQVDSSAGLSIRLSVDPVIRGWKIGIPGMRAGGARILVIPPELGYGFREVGAIPPNSTLIFRVQLISVQ
jgi:FKBP-type peptidyl-prolyl cis-trans isomerase